MGTWCKDQVDASLEQGSQRAALRTGSLDPPLQPERPPFLGEWLGLVLSPCARLHLRPVSVFWAVRQAGDTWRLTLTLCPALPCPALSSDGRSPLLVIVCSTGLHPPSSPAPPLACKVCFLAAAPTTHLGSARSPSSSSLPPRRGWD